MEPKKTDNALSQWLDKIQQDSWQLELIISGFVIFLLIGVWQPIMDYEYQISLLMDVDISYLIASIAYYTIRTGYQALLFCLLVHLLLRGLWIAAIGLRSVSGDIDYDHLRYQKQYKNWLSNRIGSFDAYVERLERYCSVLFSLAFLILFCFISVATYTVFVAGLQLLIELLFSGDDRPSDRFGLINDWFGILYLLFGIVYVIDFFSFGFFKRNRYTAKPYYYIYRFMGWVTLARFYRPLYYNLIDHGFGRKLARFLPLFILTILVSVSVIIIKYGYFPYYAGTGEVWVDHYNYDDSRQEPLWRQTWRVSLNSKYVTNDYVEVFVPYRPRKDNRVIERIYPGLEPARNEGIKLVGAISLGEPFNEAANYDSLLMAFTATQQLYLDDSLNLDVKPRFHYHEKRQQPGLLYMLPAHDLATGEHKINVRKRVVQNDTLAWGRQVNLYFYK